jgi:hypothetical protein
VKESFEFSVSGVTMQGRQQVLRRLRNACMKVAQKMPGDKKIGDHSPRYLGLIRKMKLKFKPEPKNAYDPHAIRIVVWSKKKKEWICLGYVPKKYRLKYKTKFVPLNQVVGLLIKGNRLKRIYLSELTYFQDPNKGPIYFCRVTLETTPEE